MRIFEIFDTEYQKDYTDDIDPDYDEPYDDDEDSLFSDVYQDDDEHMVKKAHRRHERVDEVIDGFSYYAKIIAEKKLWDMIHFPRVYKIREEHNNGEQRRFTWQLERLYPLNTLTTDEIRSLQDRYFVYDPHEMRPSPFSLSILVNKNLGPTNAEKLIKDDNFKECVSILRNMRKVIKEMAEQDGWDVNDVVFDMHTENIMYRRTSVGPQLVFSDPFTIDISY